MEHDRSVASMRFHWMRNKHPACRLAALSLDDVEALVGVVSDGVDGSDSAGAEGSCYCKVGESRDEIVMVALDLIL